MPSLTARAVPAAVTNLTPAPCLAASLEIASTDTLLSVETAADRRRELGIVDPIVALVALSAVLLTAFVALTVAHERGLEES